MFKGKAELVDPEKNTPIATFTETCQSDGTAKMKVVLKAPITISGTERLAMLPRRQVRYHSDQKSRWSSRNAPCRNRKGDDPRGTVLVEDHGPLLARHRRFFLPHSSSSSRFTADHDIAEVRGLGFSGA